MPLSKDLLFTDDLLIVTESEEELQERVVQWQENLEKKGLRVGSKKTSDGIIQARKESTDQGQKQHRAEAGGGVLLSRYSD